MMSFINWLAAISIVWVFSLFLNGIYNPSWETKSELAKWDAQAGSTCLWWVEITPRTIPWITFDRTIQHLGTYKSDTVRVRHPSRPFVRGTKRRTRRTPGRHWVFSNGDFLPDGVEKCHRSMRCRMRRPWTSLMVLQQGWDGFDAAEIAGSKMNWTEAMWLNSPSLFMIQIPLFRLIPFGCPLGMSWIYKPI
jgi:hypothetical protein